jgi:ATP-dependent helicase/nuclease subunit A
LVQVSAFLEYVRVVRDVDLRIGEAASQAADSVLLMTIHKAKGLEFDLVILADAGRKLRSLSEPAYLLPETRIAPRLGRLDGESLVYRYGKYIDRRQEIAEEKRLLYVACTRARQKLVLSGHVANGRLPDGFLRLLVEDAGLDINEAIQSPGEWFQSGLNTDTQVDIMVHTPDTVSNFHWQEQVVIPADVSHLEVLYRPLLQPARKHLADPDSEEDDLMLRDWRATGTKHAPALAVGVMVHRALQRWLFPGDEGYEALMRETAIREGLAHPTQRRAAVRETNKLLERFMSHELWAEIASAEIRRHEIPYSVKLAGGKVDMGVIDLLYKTELGWWMVDFKTDELRDEGEFLEKKNEYLPAMERYKQALQTILHETPVVILCFLSYKGSVRTARI